MKYNPIFSKEKEFLFSIHEAPSFKIQELGGVLDFDVSNVDDYEMIKKVTLAVMRKNARSDRKFLLWVHFIGYHIKFKYDAKWALVKFTLPNGKNTLDHFYPILIDKENTLWKVGEFCLEAYYYGKILLGDSFLTYYKLHIERAIYKTKLSDLHLEEGRLILLD